MLFERRRPPWVAQGTRDPRRDLPPAHAERSGLVWFASHALDRSRQPLPSDVMTRLDPAPGIGALFFFSPCGPANVEALIKWTATLMSRRACGRAQGPALLLPLYALLAQPNSQTNQDRSTGCRLAPGLPPHYATDHDGESGRRDAVSPSDFAIH